MNIHLCFEGSDGCGKTTMIQRLANTLTQAGHTVATVKQPGSGTKFGDEMRRFIISGEIEDPWTERLAFFADNMDFMRTRLPVLKKENDFVLQDRSNFISDMIYGSLTGVSEYFIKQVHAWAAEAPVDNFFDAVVLCHCPKATAQERRRERGTTDAIEGRGEDYMDKVHDLYAEKAQDIALRHTKLIVRVNTEIPVDECFDKMFQSLGHVPGFPEPF